MVNHRESAIPGPLPFPSRSPRPASPLFAGRPPHFRLVAVPGFTHHEMDALYETLDAAWKDALRWWTARGGDPARPCELGVEVSTRSGQWRTVRHPGSADIRGNSCALLPAA
jgi:hypothetical protein